jgi:hypothetical protein
MAYAMSGGPQVIPMPMNINVTGNSMPMPNMNQGVNVNMTRGMSGMSIMSKLGINNKPPSPPPQGTLSIHLHDQSNILVNSNLQ